MSVSMALNNDAIQLSNKGLSEFMVIQYTGCPKSMVSANFELRSTKFGDYINKDSTNLL